VILDYEMPVMTGMEALRQIRTHNPHRPIWILTAHTTDKDKEVGYMIVFILFYQLGLHGLWCERISYQTHYLSCLEGSFV
jgi:CheY-like chemotaxis protein